MNADSFRLHYTYLIAILVIVGSGYMLLTETPGVTGEQKLALVTFVLGLVLGFIFNRESSAGSARATERAIAQGATTVQGGDPPPPPAEGRQPA